MTTENATIEHLQHQNQQLQEQVAQLTQALAAGIQPQIAQTLVHLGADLSGIRTQGSLQSGIAAALSKTHEHSKGA